MATENKANLKGVEIDFIVEKMNVKGLAKQAEDCGDTMRKDIGIFASDLKKRGIKLSPIEIENNHADDFSRYIIKYAPSTNKLFRVRRTTTGEILTGSMEGIGFDIPTDQQKEEFFGELKNKEWLTYGPKIIDKMEREVQKLRGVKKLSSPIPQNK